MARRDADVHTGYNDLKQVEMFVETAEKMVGQATMQLDPEMLRHAEQAVKNRPRPTCARPPRSNGRRR